MELKKGDSVICDLHKELGVGTVCFFWVNGNVDINYPEGKKLMNWPQSNFVKVEDN